MGLAGACATAKPVAKKRVVFLDFSGPQAKRVRNSIVGASESDYVLVPKKDYYAAAKRLRAQRMRPRHIARVAAELGLDAVVVGKVVAKRRRRYTVRVRLYSGVDGARAARFEVPLDGRKVDGPVGEQIRSELQAAVAGIQRPEPEMEMEPDAVAVPDDSAEEAPGTAEPASPSTGGKGKGKGKGKSESDPERADSPGDDEPAPDEPYDLKVDEAGQVIDDEEPPMPPK